MDVKKPALRAPVFFRTGKTKKDGAQSEIATPLKPHHIRGRQARHDTTLP